MTPTPKKRQRRRRRKGYRAASAPLTKVLGRYGIKTEIREHRLLSHWSAIVGERIASKTFPDGLEKGVLWVRVASSAWLHELSFARDAIIEKANAEIGDERVRDIKLHLGGRRTRSDDPLAPTIKIRRIIAKERELPPPAVGQALDTIRSEVEAVADDDLRAVILDVRRKLSL